MTIRTMIMIATISLATALSVVSAQAGCGCDKPPPPLADVRPAFASPGDTVNLFAAGLVPGQTYTVTFTNGTATASTTGVAASRRDFADGAIKPQVSVAMPTMPLGPTAITVSAGLAPILAVPPTSFTALPAALALTEENGSAVFYCYRAAVGADGTTYISLNVGAITQHMVFNGFGQAYPITFGAADVAIYNTQGVLMQLLGPNNASIYSIKDDKGSDNSFSLIYDRHEFETYRTQHVHEGNLLLDPSDPVWHLEGTRHIDHDNLVLAIRGKLRTGVYPTPGASKSFNFSVSTTLDVGTTAGKTLRNVDFCTR